MKKIEEIKNQEWNITSPELEKITILIEELEFLKKNTKITEASLRKLKNISREVQNLEEVYTTKLINLLKQHHMVD